MNDGTLACLHKPAALCGMTVNYHLEGHFGDTGSHLLLQVHRMPAAWAQGIQLGAAAPRGSCGRGVARLNFLARPCACGPEPCPRLVLRLMFTASWNVRQQQPWMPRCHSGPEKLVEPPASPFMCAAGCMARWVLRKWTPWPVTPVLPSQDPLAAQACQRLLGAPSLGSQLPMGQPGLGSGGGAVGGVCPASKNLLQIRENMKELDFGFPGLLNPGVWDWGDIWWQCYVLGIRTLQVPISSFP